MNAIDFLIKEHNRVRKMLADINDASHREETRRKLFAVLSQDLIRHEKMEHAVWYPHFKDRLDDTVKHLVSEEKGAERAIKQLDDTATTQTWEEQFSKFKKDVEHHATEEEQILFPKVKTLLSEEQLEKIGQDMFHFKQDHQPSTH
ncbi:hemerythrin domain-containing protein [Legionella taurinensis]|uniref:Hemerythrin n=1 Tax=Legionella taurinensis TaxID=70611 RepID=A0A3A5LJ53_9GAMM|nr:hemerythrin domain-containing protein [Legionella taurinensis]MDX1837433.1 hemerythrin domain-containing protein [Legionella taurinensis]PUT40779.1 hemerythrin [Legionella taurinensis]PUT44201.1 hemerythrin [Legionella taurinensis]PUT47502.1 hemerythrin [Legionella taurinensis]PUT48641.1 hemerythrin [Legionella taurinensis]